MSLSDCVYTQCDFRTVTVELLTKGLIVHVKQILCTQAHFTKLMQLHLHKSGYFCLFA